MYANLKSKLNQWSRRDWVLNTVAALLLSVIVAVLVTADYRFRSSIGFDLIGITVFVPVGTEGNCPECGGASQEV
jgi:hypothetical protein